MSDERPIIRFASVEKSFVDGTKTRTVLTGVDLTVKAGELVAIVGASGSGKTTLLNLIGGLDGAFKGSAEIFGKSLGRLDDDARAQLRNKLVGFVFQAFHLLEHLSVLENVKLPLWLGAPDPSITDEEARGKECLRAVNLEDRAGDRIGPLSGGERQRVAIARAMVNHPRLILADEPTGNLDAETGAAIFALFDRIRKSEAGCAVVVVTHDPRVATRADRVLTLDGGKLK